VTLLFSESTIKISSSVIVSVIDIVYPQVSKLKDVNHAIPVLNKKYITGYVLTVQLFVISFCVSQIISSILLVSLVLA
jgi:hypothetical protein